MKMAEYSDLKPLAVVSTEVDESQTKIILATECIKSQIRIFNKLRTESWRHKDSCNNLKSVYLQVEAEIRNAEREKASFQNAIRAIKSGNIESQKELILADIKLSNLDERINEHEEKYEELWLQAKERFESIPFYQKWMQETKKYESITETLNNFENEANSLNNEFETKRLILLDFEKKQIIQVSEFFIHKMPENLKIIKEKSAKVMELEKDIKRIIEVQEKGNRILRVKSPMAKELSNEPNKAETIADINWPRLNNKGSLLMPKLQLANVELDVISVKLHQMKKGAPVHIAPINKANTTKSKVKTSYKEAEAKLNDVYTSAYFMKFTSDTKDYSTRKIINILEDIELDSSEVHNIVSKVNLDKLQGVTTIGADCGKPVDGSVGPTSDKTVTEIGTEQIDLTTAISQNILSPPTQFLDTIFSQASQENKNKKRFHLPMTIQEITDDLISEDDDKSEENATQTIESKASNPNMRTADDNYIKDINKRKLNLDMSPQFVYARNLLLQKNNDQDKVVTSKFFNQEKSETDKAIEANKEVPADANAKQTDENIKSPTQNKELDDRNVINNEADESVTSPKEKGPEKLTTGILFSHADHGILDSLDVDVSINTTGYEDGDADFPSCLDRSLLLSPKADLPLCDDDNGNIESQGMPGFLRGFRRGALSFFGNTPPSEANPGRSTQKPENNFNFNFGGGEKKKFNFFH